MANDEINTLREKSELYDMWECVHDLKRCSGHTDLRIFDNYVKDE